MAIDRDIQGLMMYGFFRHFLDEKVLLKCDIDDGKEILREVRSGDLGFWDWIRTLFGFPPPSLKLENIRRVAEATIKSLASEPGRLSRLDGDKKKYMYVAIRRLNQSIDEHNNRTPFWGRVSEIENLEIPAGLKLPPAAEQETFPKEFPPGKFPTPEELPPLARIRGIDNPGSLCYFISSLVALCASPSFRKALQHRSGDIAGFLRSVFQDMMSKKSRPLGLENSEEASLSLLYLELVKGGFGYMQDGHQQDEQEFLSALIVKVLGDPTWSVEERVKLGEESLGPLGERGISSEILPLLTLTDINVTTVSPSTLVLVRPKEGDEPFPLEEYFAATKTQSLLDFQSLRSLHSNREILEGLSSEQQKKIPKDGSLPISSLTTNRIRLPAGQEPPTFLPFHISRFVHEGTQSKKLFTRVVPTLHLTVPFVRSWEGGGEEACTRTYILRSVVAHVGEDIGHGHYVTYIPDPSREGPSGIPERWVKASDNNTKEVCSWEDAGDEISQNCYVLMYDLEAESEVGPA